MDNLFFLPENHSSSTVDILIVTGDAYIDHPSFGTALISRVLHDAGYSVAILSQPDYQDKSLLARLPEVRLFVGISAGNIDSIVNNYTGSRNRRRDDAYCIDGNPLFPEGHARRPDRATIAYTSFFKQRYKGVPIVLGGIEASLRRFAHYDYVQDKIRRSVLLDSKASIISYGMGERSMVEIARRIETGESLIGIEGTVSPIKKAQLSDYQYKMLPSFDDINADKTALLEATRLIEANMVPDLAENLVQQSGESYIIAFRPQPLLSTEELDHVHNLPFRRCYPEYAVRVPAWQMIQNSITSHRGCYGRCSFCAIASHQGPLVTSRSQQSVLAEVDSIAKSEYFHGTISDIGGPTANMYASSCKIGGCKDPHCLHPNICPNLILDQAEYVRLLESAKKRANVKHVFVTSGLRYDMMLEDENSSEALICEFTSGHLKIAPEHTEARVLGLMRKPNSEVFERFVRLFERIKQKKKLKFYILPYIILSHPGSDLDSVHKMGQKLLKLKIKTRQYQDFTPTPQTVSTAMFVSGKDMNHKAIPVPRYSSNNNPQRKILESYMKR